ncbi:predicted protein [Scheffersomyces stipitis CBS 6054]|uniref:Uncharacterized protein n=1 Tax=Scheffersomyces stipitis (strain ATCC 58785 / CBS 6054 / NBRC 10063 / NRRL Y-11545) TaxID=322104 RepID=A3GI59_PICST|nr:predicted protein [Scheffersomyces stipitis CBS 6054]EAZ63177.1 predicted protein [Scheffersomyces stipitis CBS 6054]KAG2735440.1 hypothetical protein G9P44_001654 [Scheffersomyces stipitis]
MSKFENSSFHREGKKGKPVMTSSIRKPQPKAPQSEFITELVETGKANWKKAPQAVRTRYYGVFMILLSVPLIIIPSLEMYRRLEGTSTKKVRQGELLEGNEVRKYDEAEKWKVEKESWTYKIFGKDFFLQGFTSKTMEDPTGKSSK